MQLWINKYDISIDYNVLMNFTCHLGLLYLPLAQQHSAGDVAGIH